MPAYTLPLYGRGGITQVVTYQSFQSGLADTARTDVVVGLDRKVDFRGFGEAAVA